MRSSESGRWRLGALAASPMMMLAAMAMALGACGSDSGSGSSSIGSPPTSEPTATSDGPTETTVAVTAPETTDVATTEAPDTTVPDTTAPVDTEPATTVEPPPEGFARPCVDRPATGDPFQFDDEADLDQFGPLDVEPALVLDLPLGRSLEVPAFQAPYAQLARVPGGFLVALSSNDYGSFEGSMLAAIDANGTTRWVRCFDRTIGSIATARASDFPERALIGVRVPQDGGFWTTEWGFVSLLDGDNEGTLADVVAGSGASLPASLGNSVSAGFASTVLMDFRFDAVLDPARDHLLAVDLAEVSARDIPLPPQAAGLDGGQVLFEYSPSGELLMLDNSGLVPPVLAAYHDGEWTSDPAVLAGTLGTRVEFSLADGSQALVGIDALGNEVWRRPELLDTGGEGFRTAVSDDITVVAACYERDESFFCTRRTLLGIETETGETVWELEGGRGVGAVSGGYALVIDGSGQDRPGWVMIDTATGESIDGQTWSDQETFGNECCGGGSYRHTDVVGGLVVAVDYETISIYYPEGADLPTQTVVLP